MHEPGAECNDLIEKTAGALSSDELQQLFLSTQRINVELCVKHGVKRQRPLTDQNFHANIICSMMTEAEPELSKLFKNWEGDWKIFLATLLRTFPHIEVCTSLDETREAIDSMLLDRL